MRYVISGLNGHLGNLLKLIKRLQLQDKDAIVIFLGNQFKVDFSWELLAWLMNNITPNGRYQAVLNKEGHMILDWYHNKYLAWKKGELADFPCVDKSISSVLYHATSLDERELLSIVDYYTSLPVIKQLIQNDRGIKHNYYVVESWLDSTIIKQLQNNTLSRKDLKCIKEYCLFYPGDGSDYTDTGRYYIVKASYEGKCYNRRFTISLPTDTLCCFCIDTETFIERGM